MTVARLRPGSISFSISSCLLPISAPIDDMPVTLPPGRARLATNPAPTGSGSNAITMGTTDVAARAARVTLGPADTSTSGAARSAWATIAGMRSSFSSAWGNRR